VHPNIVKIYIISGIIIALIWILSLLNILPLGIVGYFLLIIFTVLFIISIFSKGPNSGFRSEEDSESGVFPLG